MRTKTVPSIASPLLFASTLIACGKSDSPPVIVEPDASPDTPTATNIVTVDLFGDSPVFIRYRTNGGDWQEPVDTGKAFELRVDDDYELVAVCGSAKTGFETGAILTTYNDSPSTYVPCFGFGELSESVAVSGTMKQPGTVSFDQTISSETPNWSFDLDVSVGLHDLIALDANRSVIRRDVDISAATALSEVDTQTEGAALVEKTFTLDTTTDETVTNSVLWFTANSVAFLPNGEGSVVKLPPASQVEFNDSQFVYLFAQGAGGYRSAYVRQAETSPTDIAMLPKLSGVSLTANRATWTGMLPGTDADMYAFGDSASVYVSATAGWLATHTSLGVDTSILEPEWTATNAFYQSFEATDGAQLVFRSTGVEKIAEGKRITTKARTRASMPRWHRELAAKFRR